MPFESSRIDINSKIDKNKQGWVSLIFNLYTVISKGVVYRKMVDNIFCREEFEGKSIYRLDVNFKIQEK